MKMSTRTYSMYLLWRADVLFLWQFAVVMDAYVC